MLSNCLALINREENDIQVMIRIIYDILCPQTQLRSAKFLLDRM